MTWSIRDGREAEFLEFVNNDFTRLFLAMNVQPTEAWYAIWGEAPGDGHRQDGPPWSGRSPERVGRVRTKVGAFAGPAAKVVERATGSSYGSIAGRRGRDRAIPPRLWQTRHRTGRPGPMFLRTGPRILTSR